MRRIHLQADRHANLRPAGTRVPFQRNAGPRPGEDRCQTKRPVTSEPLILLVEDNASNRLLVRSVLEPAGFRVEVASTATQALQHLKTQTPSLILMDLELPGKDGLALTRLLKSMSPTTAIPVVAMTSHASIHGRNDAL